MPQVSIATLVAQARSQQLISFPTDTVPALASLPQSADKIYAAKGRDLSKPLILMGASAQDVWPFVQHHLPAFSTWEAIATRYWPGALTLVLPAHVTVPEVMHPQTPHTIGVRVPNCAIAQSILQQTGPLATTSINRSGEPPIRDLAGISQQFPEVYVPSSSYWPKTEHHSIPSTVIEWDAGQWIIHRQGGVKFVP